MPKKTPWIERGFAFDLPVSMFPNILERLRGTPARVEDRLRDLPPEILKRRPAGGWSIQETIGHLVLVEGLWLGRLDDFAAGLTELRPADLAGSAARIEAADFNAQETAAVLADFRRDRAVFVARLEALNDAAVGRAAHHPRLDRPMRIIDLMVFAAEHDDHHLAGISELLAGE